MKKKEIQSLRSKTSVELTKLVSSARDELAHAILKRADEKDTNAVKNLKRKIAILLTLSAEKGDGNRQNEKGAK